MTNRRWLDQVKGAAGWALAEHVLEGVLLTAPDGRVFAANSAACSILRRSEAEICRLGRDGLVAPSDPNLGQSIEERRRSGAVVTDLQMLRGDGQVAVCEIASRIFSGPGGEELTTITLRDVTERRQLERRLTESEERFRALAQATTEAVGVHDGERFLDANDAFLDLFGVEREQLADVPVFRLVDPAFRETAREFVGQSETGPVEIRLLRMDGSSFWGEVRARNVFVNGRHARVAAIRDVQARKQAERDRAELAERAAEARRMRSLAAVAAGVSHELNNALQAALIASELIRHRFGGSPEFEGLVGQFEQAIARASALGDAMIEYTGRPASARTLVDLAELAADAVEHRRQSVQGPRVVVEQEGATVALADREGIVYVTKALITNAVEASGADAVVRVRVCQVDGRQIAPETIKPFDTTLVGTYACIEVTDHGEGMDDETVRLMFDPFFTTRFLGRGLSLAAALGIIRQHNGAFSVRSSPGIGTTIAMLLPLPETE